MQTPLTKSFWTFFINYPGMAYLILYSAQPGRNQIFWGLLLTGKLFFSTYVSQSIHNINTYFQLNTVFQWCAMYQTNMRKGTAVNVLLMSLYVQWLNISACVTYSFVQFVEKENLPFASYCIWQKFLSWSQQCFY